MVNPNWDFFFYYNEGLLSLEQEDDFDLLQGVMQALNSLSYFRQEGAGIQEIENNPNGFILLLLARYNIVKWVAFRNSYVVVNNPDRQLAVSQDSIDVYQENNEVNIDVGYRNFKTINKINTTNIII
jgi:hypothetical protein